MIQSPSARIVVGFDGSSDSLAALDWAVAEARIRGTSVTACHVWHWPQSNDVAAAAQRVLTAAGEQILDQTLRHDERHANDHMHDHAGDHTGKVDLFSAVVHGRASQQLVTASADAALLVVGARGQGGLSGPRAGSVSVQAARHAHCPVVITHGGTGDDDNGAHDNTVAGAHGPIVVGVNGSTGSDMAAGFAVDEAARRHAPVHVLHAAGSAPPPTATRMSTLDPNRPQEITHQTITEWLRPHTRRHPDVEITIEIVDDDPATALLRASATAGLLVLGPHGRGGGTARLLGPTSATLLHRACCPTVLVRHQS